MNNKQLQEMLSKYPDDLPIIIRIDDYRYNLETCQYPENTTLIMTEFRINHFRPFPNSNGAYMEIYGEQK